MFIIEALKHFKEKKYGRHKQAAELAMLGTLGIDPNKRLHHIKHKHQTLFRQSSLGVLLCFLALICRNKCSI
jgi:hypothetical protein